VTQGLYPLFKVLQSLFVVLTVNVELPEGFGITKIMGVDYLTQTIEFH